MTYFGYCVSFSDRTGKKIVLIITHCGKLQIPCLCKQQTTTEVFDVICCSFLHNLEQRLSVFAQGCMEKYSVYGNSS